MDQLDSDVFISHMPEDRSWVERLTESLTRRGYIVRFDAQLQLKGEDWPQKVGDTIERSRSLIVLWSRRASRSRPVLIQIGFFTASRGTSSHRLLIFIDLDGQPIPKDLHQATVVPILRSAVLTDASQVPLEIWESMIRELVNALEPTPEPPAAHAEEESAAQQNVQPGNVPVEMSALTVDEAARRHRWFPSVRDLIAKASEIAGKDVRVVTTGLLLATISDRGTTTLSPAWASSWLRSRLSDEGNARLKQREQSVVASVQPVPAPPATIFTRGAELILQHATDLAVRTSGTSEIHLRHLLGALLTDPRGPARSGALQGLQALGHDISTLLEAYFDFVRGWDDDDDAWGNVLIGAKVEQPLLSDFNPDSASDDDQLDVRPDVVAFAGLIAARTLKPPLSIGLFGEWGSGKTFFMRMLAKQVAYLARQAREDTEKSKTRQRDQTFYRRIVQIEFNAWHYAEGNLWASLVQHIFDNLRVVDDRKRRVSEELQDPILKKLGAEKVAEAQAIREREAAEQQRRAADQALAAAKKQFEDKARELAALSGANVLASVPTAAIRTAIAPTLESLGLDVVLERGDDLRAALADAKTMLGRGQSALVPLMVGRERGRRWLHLALALLAGPAVALIAVWVMVRLGKEGIAGITAAASGAAALLAGGTTWLQQQLTWVGDHLKAVESAQRQFDKTLEAAQAENLKQVRAAEEQLRLFEADYVAAKQREEEARRRVVEAEARVREATVPRLLTTFIEERANSNDYRRHLGVLALVRNDFERLSDLISEENEALDGQLPETKGRFTTIDEELRDEDRRINRIVLYIDDLDRCPPAKVVEVLQAVHLLLAFPLFVVVVGVDARWLVRSLDARYRDLLKTDDQHDEEAGLREFTALFGKASAHDYVEKIFQVPFWLKPMTEDASRRMVRNLLKAATKADATQAVAVQPGTVEANAGQVDAAQAGAAQAAAQPATVQLGASDVHAELAAPARELAAVHDPSAPGAAPKADARPEVPDLSPESLDIGQLEIEYMSDLAPLLGRSPRTLKRFVNVYRLIRVGLSPWDRHLFLSESHGLADYRVVLLLLAVDTGAPTVATSFFNTIQGLATFSIHETIAAPPLPPTLRNLIDQLDKNTSVNSSDEWPVVRYWLSSRLDSGALPDDVVRFARWIPRVSRFSFHTGRI